MNNEKLFFTSDLHFGHENIIRFCNRPFRDADEMDRELIARWNQVVQEDGIVYLLGDVSFRSPRATASILWQLNGTIHLIRGNHDKDQTLKHHGVVNRFASIQDYLEISVPEPPRQRIIMCHFPFKSWNKMAHGSWNFFGHCHGTMKSEGKQFDVGVDTHDGKYAPYSYLELFNILEKQEVKLGVDYHGTEDRENGGISPLFKKS